MRPEGIEVGDIVRAYGAAFLDEYGATLSPEQRQALADIAACRTAALGGHVESCDTCDFELHAYNSCRNRHCPKCQAMARAIWLEAREAELLPVPYFHVVFTIPAELAELALRNPREIYRLLFSVTAETLLEVALDPKHLGARIGFLAVLHTWGQNLGHHPHLHCVIPGGGLTPDGSAWVASRANFLLPVRVLSRVFRGKFIARLRRAYRQGRLVFPGQIGWLATPEAFGAWLGELAAKEWVVYAKPPFGGPRQVLRYLARYTHRVAITGGRLLDIEDDRVRFRWKDYAGGQQWKTMTLGGTEFIRRLLLHVLPKGFMRIRYFGFMANRVRRAGLALCRTLIGRCRAGAGHSDAIHPDALAAPASTPIVSTGTCPACGRGRLVVIAALPRLPHPLGLFTPAAPNTS
jgi:hypothetical protein